MKKFTANSLIKKWILFLSLVTIIGCSGGERTRCVEDNSKEELPKLETLSNYPNSIVIDKSITDSGKCYYVTIKCPTYSRFVGIVWEVVTIRISKYEFEKCNCGDLIIPNN